MTQKCPPLFCRPFIQPTPPPAPQSQQGTHAPGWEMPPRGAGLRCCVGPPPPSTSLFWTTAGALGGGDSPLLFRTLAEILPTES